MANLEKLKLFILEMEAEHKSAVYGRNGKSKVRIPNLEEDNQVLIQAYKSTNEEVKSKGNIIPAAEWLLDNFYVIEEQFKEIQYTVKKDFYNRLPVLVEGKYSAYHRIYGIAAGMVDHLDGQVDEESLMRFLKLYQEHIHLTSKELWVFPIMLRICLLERIKDIALYISDTIKLRTLADQWAVKLVQSLAVTREEPNSKDEFRKSIQEHESKIGVMKPAYAERLLHRLREEGGDVAPIIRWVDGKLAIYRSSAEDIVHEEHQKQVNYQNSIGNAITSLRVINGLNWEEIFEELSLLNQILSQDPAEIYPLMDFCSRDSYRKKVEALAEKHGIDEIKVAVKAIECARENKDNDLNKYNHVGYYIVDEGLGQLVDKLGGRRRKINGRSLSSTLYFGSIGILTLGLWFAFLVGTWTTSKSLGLGGLLLSAVVSFLPI
ncbi:MAG: hypothetical protein GX815_08155, partial [Clostridiales bacterium]|nr:hypothetical protein [Clostridiales bacterium]